MAKDKKKKKDKKSAKGESKAAGTLKALAQNPLVADVVAAALVATAAALKDSNRARALAEGVGDELANLSKTGLKRGDAMWDLALQIGRKSLDTLMRGEDSPKAAKPKAKTASRSSSKKKPAASAAKK